MIVVRMLRERFKGAAAPEIVPKTVEAYLVNVDAESRDSVVMVNVLEHVKDDGAALSGIFRLLRPGGHLLAFVPALPWLFSAMDVALGHYRRYRKGPLIRLAESAGFEVVSARYFDIFGIVPWWAIYTLGGRTRFSPGLSKLYDRMAAPAGRALEALVPPPAGKNIVLVARKPEIARMRNEDRQT